MSPEEPREGIPDVSAMPLSELVRDGSAVLDAALRRLLDREPQQHSAFDSAVAS